MDFEIVGEITVVETIASGKGIATLSACIEAMGKADGER